MDNKTSLFKVVKPPPFDTLGLFTYLRTYARRHDENDPKSTVESWQECLERVVTACNTQLKVNFTPEEQKELFDLLYNLKCSVAGRFLWQLGTKTVDRLGLPSLQNCAFTVVNEPIRPFTWAMDFLMTGSGVGYRILPEDIKDFPIVKAVTITRQDTKDADFIIPDSREGWVKLLGKVLKAYFYSGVSFTYSCILLRSRGSPIKSFGGLASGPDVLCDGVQRICNVLNKRVGEKIHPIDALDIMNIIGFIVVSGNVRRCLPKGSLVYTEQGLIPIENIKVGTKVLTSDEKYYKVKNVFEQGKQKLIKIITEDGEFVCTANHKMAVFNFSDLYTWKEASKLQNNDKLITSRIELKGIKTKKEDVLKLFSNNTFITKNEKQAKTIQNLLFCFGYNSKFKNNKNNYIVTLGEKSKEKIVYTKVLSITENTEQDTEQDTEQETYDIEVEEKHEFFCNGYLTHNSAQIAIGSPNDKEYLLAKNWANGNIPNHRAFSNNSVVVNDFSEIENNEDFWNGYYGNGEPYGLINLELSRKCGRLGDTQYPDPTVDGFNPCSEQGLSKSESCCLSELFLPNINSKEELYKCVTYLYRICKNSLTLPCKTSQETEEIIRKNMRMGIGVTGYLQATEEQRSWLSGCYEYIREYDKKYSEENSLPTSVKLTTCKPSGCARKDMLIQTDKGILTLEEIGDIKGETWQEIKNLHVLNDGVEDTYIPNSLDTNCNEYKFNSYKVNKFYINGKVPTKLITTRDGLELEVSLSHRFRVIENKKYVWKTAKELKTGDNLVTILGGHPEHIKTPLNKIENANFEQPEHLTENISLFLGMCYSNGKIHNENIFIYVNNDNEIISWLYVFCENFGISGEIFEEFFCITSKDFVKWLRVNNYEKYSVPKCIRTSDRNNVISFINGIGTFNYWNVFTESKTFAQQFLVLCRSVGFNTQIRGSGENGYLIIFNNAKETEKRFCSPFWLDSIVTIKDSECETYDIEVDTTHHYRLGGTISHNTLSILGNTTPGVHPAFSRYYKRRVRISSESPLINIAKEHGYDVEYSRNFDNSIDHTTQIITFPKRVPDTTVTAGECTAIKQLEWVKRLQTEWSDNAVSCTVYYKKEELPEIKQWLKENYNNSIKSVSFLLHSEHGFKQAPLEEITKEEYEEMVKRCKPIHDLEGICYINESIENLSAECASGQCPIK